MNPSELEIFVNALIKAQESYPQQRIGQIIINALNINPCPKLFYVTNDELSKHLDSYATNDQNIKSED